MPQDPARHCGRSHFTECFRLRLSTPFRKSLGKVCKEHSEPEPESQLKVEAAEMGHRDAAGDYGTEEDDKHHRILPLDFRIQLSEGINDGRAKQCRIKDGGA